MRSLSQEATIQNHQVKITCVRAALYSASPAILSISSSTLNHYVNNSQMNYVTFSKSRSSCQFSSSAMSRKNSATNLSSNTCNICSKLRLLLNCTFTNNKNRSVHHRSCDKRRALKRIHAQQTVNSIRNSRGIILPFVGRFRAVNDFRGPIN